MIPITLLNGSRLYINAELVETVAAVPDTVITLTTGRKILARTPPAERIRAIIEYRRRVHLPPRAPCGPEPPDRDPLPASAGLCLPDAARRDRGRAQPN